MNVRRRVVKSTTQTSKDLQKVMRELMAIERYWEFQESINYENANWNNVNAFIKSYVNNAPINRTYDNTDELYDEETFQAIYNSGYIQGLKYAQMILSYRFDEVHDVKLPKELIDSETSDVLYGGVYDIFSYIESDQVHIDAEEE
tara:strand:+ start:385 stop:819 length:435 start_codon:yes stop_codon:yes gene_type:complete